jgi:hypothetical protein
MTRKVKVQLGGESAKCEVLVERVHVEVVGQELLLELFQLGRTLLLGDHVFEVVVD